MNVLEVLQVGPLCTVQDLGRPGWGRFGVPVSGALDRFSHGAANLLVGNPEAAATLEMTFLGMKLKALAPAMVCVCGAQMPLKINQKPAPLWTSLSLRPGDVLAIGAARKGVRGYLAVGGGVKVPKVMGSRATYLEGALGGFKGRPLRKGDVLARGPQKRKAGILSLPPKFWPAMENEMELRALPGPQDDYFGRGLEVFFSGVFKVSTDSDRVGCRLKGRRIPFKKGAPNGIVSEPMMPGGVQVTAQGDPIILLYERTVGGYAKIATVISPDLAKVAQARPGSLIRFKRVGLAQGRELYLNHQRRLQAVRAVLAGQAG